MWEEMGLVEAVGTPEWRYVGPRAMREYGVLRNRAPTPVPIETDGGPGTAGGHWDETALANELMTGFVNGANNPLSRVTIACLEDMGYQVNYEVADGYSLPRPGRSVLSRSARQSRPCRVTHTKPQKV